jgi:hypothetical protein
VVNPPEHAVSLDEAHSAIDLWQFYSQKTLDSPQVLAVEFMMAENSLGKWAVKQTGRCAARQNGKGDEIEVVELWDLVMREGSVTMHTAHEIPAATNAHERLVALIESHADLRRAMYKPRWAPGTQGIEMNNGSKIHYRTRTGSGARGQDDISRLVIDEAQHAQPEQLASSLPIVAVNPNSQVNFTGSAGLEKSVVWWNLRKAGLRGDPGMSWLENTAEIISIDENGNILSVTPDVRDPGNWSKANWAYPSRISEEFLLSELAALGPNLFAREHLVVWDPEPGMAGGAIDIRDWVQMVDPGNPPKPKFLGVAVDIEQKMASIGATDGKHVGSVNREPLGPWTVGVVADLAKKYRIPVVIDSGGPAASLIEPISVHGVQVRRVTAEDYKIACSDFYEAVKAHQLKHGSYPDLDAAVRNATWRMLGDRRVWGRKDGDISMLEAVTLAYWGAVRAQPLEPIAIWG